MKSDSDYLFLKRAYFLFVLAVVIYRALSHSLLHQLDSPVLIYPGKDEVYWAFHFFKIPRLLTQQYVSWIFDGLLLFLIAANIFKPRNTIFSIAFTLMLTTYFICINTFYAHHYHNLIPLIAVSFVFWARWPKSVYLFQAARYYCLYAFGSAAIWKLCRGTLTEVNHLSNILKGTHSTYLIQNAETPGWKSACYTYLITHEKVAHLFFIGLFTMQLLFFTGFITSKLDALLFIVLLLFVIANYFMMGMVSYEILAIGFVLLNWNRLREIAGKRFRIS